MAASSTLPRLAAPGALSARLRGAYGLRLLAAGNEVVLLTGAILLAFGGRLAHLLAAGGFPLNDGGMFAVMIEDLRRAGYSLPEYTSYNGGAIPFAYPPLPFYLAAAIADLSGASVIDILRFAPLVASTLTVPAFFFVAVAMLPDRRQALLATAIFGLIPSAFAWEIAGGGLTRATGFLFAILAVGFLYRLTLRPSLGLAVAGAVTAALTLLCHLEMALLIAAGYAVFLVAYGRNPRSISHAAGVAVGALLLAAPWVGTVIAYHGIDPFLAAASTGSHTLNAVLAFLVFPYTREPYLPLVAILGVIGAVASFARRQPLLPALLVILFLLDPRKASTTATLPLAMLAAQATLTVLVPQLARLREAVSARPLWLVSALPAAVVFYTVISALAAPSIGERSPIRVLPASDREAMRWIAANTPAAARFLVIEGNDYPWTDTQSEWFPALTSRVSVNTVQGTEWFPGPDGMNAARERYQNLQLCANRDAACVEQWSQREGRPYTHLFVAKAPGLDQAKVGASDKNCCDGLSSSLLASGRYALIYDGPTARVFELIAVGGAAR